MRAPQEVGIGAAVRGTRRRAPPGSPSVLACPRRFPFPSQGRAGRQSHQVCASEARTGPGLPRAERTFQEAQQQQPRDPRLGSECGPGREPVSGPPRPAPAPARRVPSGSRMRAGGIASSQPAAGRAAALQPSRRGPVAPRPGPSASHPRRELSPARGVAMVGVAYAMGRGLRGEGVA